MSIEYGPRFMHLAGKQVGPNRLIEAELAADCFARAANFVARQRLTSLRAKPGNFDLEVVRLAQREDAGTIDSGAMIVVIGQLTMRQFENLGIHETRERQTQKGCWMQTVYDSSHSDGSTEHSLSLVDFLTDLHQ